MQGNIEERVKAIMAEQLGVTLDTLKPEANVNDDLGADSLDEVEMLMALEDEFGIEVPDHDADKLKTVQQIVDYITAREPT